MKMIAPEDACSSITIEGGMEYIPNDDGEVEVKNAAHVDTLRMHGYTDAPVAAPTGPKGRTKIAAREAPDPDEDDEFDGMTKGELIEWLEDKDVEIPAKPKLVALQELARETAADMKKKASE
jgi:hypothetical protein